MPSLRFLTLRSVLIVCCCSAALVYGSYVFRWIDTPTHGFAMYYTFARMLLEGEDFSQVYEYDHFNSKVHSYGMPDVLDMPNNPPTNALAMVPVAWLEPATAKIAWTLLSLALFLWSIALLFKLFELRLTSTAGLVVIVLVFLWRPAYDAIALGQLYMLLLFLFTLSVFGVSRSRPTLAGLPVAFCMLVKGYGLSALMWMGMKRQWPTGLLVLGGILFGILVTLPTIGVSTWQTFYDDVLSTLGVLPTDGHVAFQTINGLLLHVFRYDPTYLPHPLVVLPTILVRLISYALNLTVLFIIVRRGQLDHPEERTLSYAAALAAGVVTAPLAEEYHFVLFLPLIIGMTAAIARQHAATGYFRKTDWVVLASVVVMALPWKYKTLNDATFPLFLLAYPKLYAGLSILACYVWRSNAQRSVEPPLLH